MNATHVATPFERDIASQADALRGFHSAPAPELTHLDVRDYERIVLTGMGSSHFAALPTWRHLTGRGHAAWWIDSGQLLDSPHLVTDSTLLIATSQSGASGEIVALLDSAQKPAAVIAVTNDENSPLATAADFVVGLHSGSEATVSTKSYINTLAAHDRLTAALTGKDIDDIPAVAQMLEKLTAIDELNRAAAEFVSTDDPRLAYVGFADYAATALYAGLITKEGAKIPAEGYIGGQFRHGPMELAGPGLTAVLFGAPDPNENPSLRRLAADLVATGSTVIAAAAIDVPGVTLELSPPHGGLTRQLAHGAVIAQHLTTALGRARGIIPGAFTYGNKITTAL